MKNNCKNIKQIKIITQTPPNDVTYKGKNCLTSSLFKRGLVNAALAHANNITKKTNENSEVSKSKIRLSWINLILLGLGFLNFIILTYFYIKSDIRFQANGWFPMTPNSSWYAIFLVLIVARISIVFSIQNLAEKIKNSFPWEEKKKKNALNGLFAFSFLTIPFNVSLISGLLFYIFSESEILCKNVFLGTFHRLLSPSARELSYQQIVKNFLEKSEIPKTVEDQLKTWAQDNSKNFLVHYDKGETSATKYISAQLEKQKEILCLEEINKMDTTGNQIVKDRQGLLPWLYENTLGYLDPFHAEPKACMAAWGVVLVTAILIFAFAKWNVARLTDSIEKDRDIHSLAEITKKQILSQENLKQDLIAQNRQVEINKNNTIAVIEQINNKINHQQKLIERLSELGNLNRKANEETQIQLNNLEAKYERDLRIPKSFREETKATVAAKNHAALTQGKKDEFLTMFSQKYGDQDTVTIKTFKETINALLNLFPSS